MMYHVLLVDDEVHAVRGVQAGVNWEKLNVTTLYTAYNLKQAQAILNSNQVDVMISDIEMPGGSGLELLSWVNELFPNTIAILLTCHADFSYAKKALQLKSFDYLLKPVDYAEVESVLKRGLSTIQQESKTKETFWMDLLSNNFPIDSIDSEIIKRKVKLNLSQKFLPILFHVQSWKRSISNREKKLMDFALKNIVEEKVPSIMLSLSQEDYLVIVAAKAFNNEHELRLNCESFIQLVQNSYSIELCGYLGERVQIKEVPSMVEDLQTKRQNHVPISRKVYSLIEMNREEMTMPIVPWENWSVWLKEGANEKLLEEIQSFFRQWENEGKVNVNLLCRFHQNFLQMLLHVLNMKGLQSQDVFTSPILTERTIFNSFTLFQDWVFQVTKIAIDHIRSIEMKKNSVVDTVKQLINENIGMPQLSREWLANAVFLNPDYISRLFKKETGLLISEYLQQQRIEYAKKLLLHTNKSVTDIALAVGYSNISYFSTTFKKSLKMGPAEFRKCHQKG